MGRESFSTWVDQVDFKLKSKFSNKRTTDNNINIYLH